MFAKLCIAVTPDLFGRVYTARGIVDAFRTDFTDVCALVCSESDSAVADRCRETGFGIPIFFAEHMPSEAELEKAAGAYEESLLPPFFNVLSSYSTQGNDQLDCPGHQCGAFFRRHPAGKLFYDFFGPRLFSADLNNGDVALGDLLIHEGPPLVAQKAAARTFHADKTYFVLNGTSASNKIAMGAVLAPGDLVLFDRNNHKSVHQGIQLTGALPVYLETSRNGYGFIGGIKEHCFDHSYLRKKAAEISPAKAALPRPFRLAVIQLATYDGTVYDARYVVDKIGSLCDYILFDSAWAGYEQFIDVMRDCSPMLLSLRPGDPGILVTQSVHKQLAGFSMASQIHKKDSHIKGQDRYVPHKRMNNAFLLHSSTSPFYPMFAALDVNAKIHEGPAAREFWKKCVLLGIETRKDILRRCQLIRPFVNPVINGRAWEDYPSEEIAKDKRFFAFEPGDSWHGYSGYGEKQYYADPCKILLTTPGVNLEKGTYEDCGIPACVLASYLRSRRVIPEKCDLNSLLILLTPAENEKKLRRLVDALSDFENLIAKSAPLADVLPEICQAYPERYKGYTLNQLCQDIHDLYRRHDMKNLLRRMFREDELPKYKIHPAQAQARFIRGEYDYVPLREAAGRVAAEGALPYPPGVYCCVAGEVWGSAALEYFLAIEDLVNSVPGFQPEVQGAYFEKMQSGRSVIYVNVLKKSDPES